MGQVAWCIVLLAASLPGTALGAAPRSPRWKSTIGGGLNVVTGTSGASTFKAAAALSREGPRWRLAGRIEGTYGRSRQADGSSLTSASRGATWLRIDRLLGPRWSVYALGGLEFDHVAGVEYRSVSEVGGSAQWLDVKTKEDWLRAGLRTDAGVRYGYEARWSYFGDERGARPGVELVAPHAGLAFVWGFSKDVSLCSEAEATVTASDGGRVLLKSVTKLSSRLAGSLTLGVSYGVEHDSRPSPGGAALATELSTVLELGL